MIIQISPGGVFVEYSTNSQSVMGSVHPCMNVKVFMLVQICVHMSVPLYKQVHCSFLIRHYILIIETTPVVFRPGGPISMPEDKDILPVFQ